MENTDLSYMEEALKEAESAFAQGEVPVGAVIVFQNQIITRAHNHVETLFDATAHAELLCIRKASHHLSNWRLTGCTLYTTLEPCPMCAGALISSRIDRVVWGAPDIRQGAGGSLISLLGQPHPIHTPQVTSGILADPSAALLKQFFKEKRWKKSLTSS